MGRRAAIYAHRIASDSIVAGGRIADQIERCRKHAEHRRCEVGSELVVWDEGPDSAALLERPALCDLFEKADQWDVLICSDFRYLSADPEEGGWIGVLLESGDRWAEEASRGTRLEPLTASAPSEAPPTPRIDELSSAQEERDEGAASGGVGIQQGSLPSESETSTRAIPRAELARCLRAHKRWLGDADPARESGPGAEVQPDPSDGANRADLSALDLSNLPLFLVDLRRAVLKNTDLSRARLTNARLCGADLTGSRLTEATLRATDLTGAILREANLSGATLRDAILDDAVLANANLTRTRGLMARQLSGADVMGAGLPKELAEFKAMEAVEKACSNARKIYLAMLASCAYVVLTVLATRPEHLLAGNGTASLPFIQTAVSISGFYLLAPCALLGCFVYLQLCLQNIWFRLAGLPARLPDGRRIDLAVDPWLLTGLVSHYFPLLREERRPADRLQVALIAALVWCLVPATLGVVWWCYLVRGDALGTAVHVLLFAAGLGLAYACWRSAGSILRRSVHPARAGSGLRWPGRTSALTVALLALMVSAVSLYSLEAIGGRTEMTRPSFRGHDLSAESGATIVQLKPYLAGAVLYELDLSMQDLSDAVLTGSDLRGVRLDRANLQRAKLDDALMANSNLERTDLSYASMKGADLWSASLKGATLERADLRNAKLETAILEDANLTHARLEGAILDGASLKGSDLTKADLSGEARLEAADLSGAVLVDAKLGSADLTNATLARADLTRADLERAHLRCADLSHARLTGANLKRARLRDADLREATLAEARLQGAFLTNADLSGAQATEASLKKARLRGSNLSGADLSGAYLVEAKLEGAFLAGAVLEKTNFDRAVLTHTRLEGVDLRNTVGLETGQLLEACLDSSTQLPAGVFPPAEPPRECLKQASPGMPLSIATSSGCRRSEIP
jgi:uncharacterized protein YjbI with pentapeptide repeats